MKLHGKVHNSITGGRDIRDRSRTSILTEGITVVPAVTSKLPGMWH